ncbi:GLPGLI family protein [Runella aurantiaca]|uniref:GLPGLI family protein n=1 Tax=Runella aurantiaca TaxID=2282308 RepID=A0A369ID52_9BACT|nr:GLPGLI family protein [Runella aurantiaca]RDB06780.1 GLPGLI family protein [Runella aurantiaca]
MKNIKLSTVRYRLRQSGFAILALISLGFSISAKAQQTEGMVTYEYKYYWTKVNSRLTFLSKEEKDRMKLTWGNEEDGPGTKMKLTFNDKQSIYTYFSDQGQTEDGRYSWRQSDYLIHRNFEQEKLIENHEMLGKTYLLEDSLMTYNWRIQNQIKDVAGYVCMKAETFDPIKNHKITAWFAQDIPVPAGPERYFGLPGLILELDINDGDVIVAAQKVELKNVDKELALPKMKGKKIKNNDYDQMLKKHIFDSIKAQRNPYWSIRY